MAPRANWKGFLRLSLVTCPVALYPATSESEKISFNQLNRATGHRIKYLKVDADTGEEVPNEDIVKGWGAGSNLFHQGAAKETDDPDTVAATMAKPGVVLKRPAGSNGRFAEHSDLPSDLGSGENGGRRERRRPKPARRTAPKISERAARKAAADFEKEQKRRDAERRREEAIMAKERERREKAVAKAQAALDDAKAEHDATTSAIEAERAAFEKRAEDEEVRWEKRKEKLEAALRRARE